MSRTRLLDLFSGIGGFSLAFERAGFTTAAHSEVEAFPNRVLAHHWPETPNLGDVTRWPEWGWPEMEDVDVVSFGSPCQDLSVAGKRAGLSGERSGLFHDAVGAVRRSGARFALWENVPGAMYCNGGRDFGAVLDALADAGALDVAWRVLDAQYFGVPQRRRRIFLVADFRGERAAEILFEPEGVRGHPQKSREAGQSVAGTLGGGSSSRGWADDTDRMTFVPVASKRLAGNHRLDAETETFVTHALTGEGFDASEDGTGRGTPLITPFSNRGADTGSVAFPLRSDPHGALPAIALQYATSHREKRQNGLGIAEPGDPMYTLDTFANHAVAYESGQGWWNEDESAGTLRAEGENRPSRPSNVVYPKAAAFCAGNSEGAGSIGYEAERSPTLRGAASGTNMTPTVHEGMAVRRLTPLECERLQGYPDSFTDIPGASDSARYRALGNSVAVPVVEWIAHRMARVLEEV